MSVAGLRRALQRARLDGAVDVGELDRLLLEARDGRGLSAAERRVVLEACDGFDDAVKQRVLSHLAALGQRQAWVSVQAAGAVVQVEGRYATLAVDVPGLAARLGLFDSCLALAGVARADGLLRLTVEGRPLEVPVRVGDTGAVVLARAQARLPKAVTGVLLQGDVRPFDPVRFSGPEARADDHAAHLVLSRPQALGLRDGERPLRVVVTGYGAFLGVTDNPSAALAQRLAEAGVPGGVVEYRRLDVTTEAVDAFLAELRRAPPDLVLSLGVTHGQAQVEERPENHLGAASDGLGRPMPERAVRPGGPREVRTDLPVETVEWALARFGAERRVFTSRSDAQYAPDRSAYLCNYLGYLLATEFGETPATTAGFMHVTPDTPTEQIHAVLTALAARQLEVRRSATPHG